MLAISLRGGESATDENTVGFAVLSKEKEGEVSIEPGVVLAHRSILMVAVMATASVPSSLTSTKDLCMTVGRNSYLMDNILEKYALSHSKASTMPRE